MRHYNHMQKYERIVIHKMMYGPKKVSKSKIAKVLGRSPSTISREIKRNSTKGYNWHEAQDLWKMRRKMCKAM